MVKLKESNFLDMLDDLEQPSIMKIYTHIIRPKYKRQTPYAYPKHLVPVSARYNGRILDFLDRPLEEKIFILGKTLFLMLTQQEGEAPQNCNKTRTPRKTANEELRDFL